MCIISRHAKSMMSEFVVTAGPQSESVRAYQEAVQKWRKGGMSEPGDRGDVQQKDVFWR